MFPSNHPSVRIHASSTRLRPRPPRSLIALGATLGATLALACSAGEEQQRGEAETTARSEAALASQAPGAGSGLLWLSAFPQFSTNQLRIWDMVTSSSFKDLSISWTDDTSWVPLGSGDFDGDGHGDVLWHVGDQNGLSIWSLHDTFWGSELGTTYNMPEYQSGLGDPHIADLNGDGISDIVWTGVMGSPTGRQYRAETWLMNKGSTVPAKVIIRDSHDTEVLAVGNFDRQMGHGADYLQRSDDGTVSVVFATTRSASTYTEAFDQVDSRGYTGDGVWAASAHIGQCSIGDYVSGISASPWFSRPDTRAHSALCTHQGPYSLKMPESQHSLTGPDDRGDSATGDWDYGYYKAECARGEVVTGIAQDYDLNMTRLLCTAMETDVTADDSRCTTLVLSHYDDNRLSTASGEWAQNYIKNECRPDQILKGISRTTDTGEPHAILCCDTSQMVIGQASSDWTLAGVGDLTKDGVSDLIWYNAHTGEVASWAVFPGQAAVVNTLGTVLPSTNWEIVGVGDVTHDGVSDIIWRNAITGAVHVWEISNGPGLGIQLRYTLGPDLPEDPNAVFGGVIQLGPPDPPTNIHITSSSSASSSLGVTFDSPRRIAGPVGDSVEVFETVNGVDTYRSRYSLPDKTGSHTITLSIRSPWTTPWQSVCFKLRTWEQGRVSAMSGVTCNNAPPPPPPVPVTGRAVLQLWGGGPAPLEGTIWYGTSFPPLSNHTGHALSVQNPSTMDYISFPKAGRTTDDCGDGTNSVTLPPLASLTAANMASIFGSAMPALPINLVACTSSSPPESGNLVLPVTYTTQ